MKASDFVVEFLIHKGITDVFGYPGGMVIHLMESLDKYSDQIATHLNYHEQACAMAACGWAEIAGRPGVAYATSGPGATNLLTGIACAYFESLPCIFITGQVNTFEQKGELRVRQRGFQETDIVTMAAPITKRAFMVTDAEDLPNTLSMAYNTAMEGRRGPVLIDIPMDVFRGEVSPDVLCPKSHDTTEDKGEAQLFASDIISALQHAQKPMILAGHGISLAAVRKEFRAFVELTGIPIVTSMIAIDVLPTQSPYCYGMIGAYGTRWANFLIDHCDCLLTLGSRLDSRQTGVNKALFAPGAQILRVDVDDGEMENAVNAREKDYCISLEKLLPALIHEAQKKNWNTQAWRRRCNQVKKKLMGVDQPEPGNRLVEEIGNALPDHITVTTDVGQNQVWTAQSMPVKLEQRVLFCGGHGAMGYSLPAAIGAAVAGKQRVICMTGDGGLQMNIQELQLIVREKLPVKIVVLNNQALGMIHHFQEMYFCSNYAQTDEKKGYTVPDFISVAKAYGIRSTRCKLVGEAVPLLLDNAPALIEFVLPRATHVYPKLGLNKPIHEQEPPIAVELLEELAELCVL